MTATVAPAVIPVAGASFVRPLRTGDGLRLYGSSSGYVGLKPAAAAGSTDYTLPAADGTNGQVLSTNGSGTLSWATASGASPSGSGTELQYRSGASTFGAVTGSSTANGGIALVSQAAATALVTLTGHASQSGDFLAVKNSGGTSIARITSDASFYFGANAYAAMSSNQSTWYMQNAGDTKFYIQTNSLIGLTRIDSDHKIWLAPNNTVCLELTTGFHMVLGGTASVSEFRMLEASANGTNYTGFKPPSSLSGNVVYEMPAADGSANQFLKTNGSAVLSWGTPSGLSKFTEAESTSSPNGTVYVDSLTAAGSSTNADAVIRPKGTGAFLTAIPDSTSTGGNKRGTNAVDLQTSRSQASQVASGTTSTIGGGTNNTASATSTTVAGGDANTASAAYSAIAGGSTNTASASYAAVGGGLSNTASGSYAAIPGGTLNTASGNYSQAGGTRAVANKSGQHAQASGMFAASGDAQTSVLTARATTTNATSTNLWLNGSSELLTIATDTTWAFSIMVVARRTDADNESAAYKFEGCIDRNGSTTALVGSVTKTVLAEDTAAWDCDVTADDTNDALQIGATGENGKTITWVARIELTEVTG